MSDTCRIRAAQSLSALKEHGRLGGVGANSAAQRTFSPIASLFTAVFSRRASVSPLCMLTCGSQCQQWRRAAAAMSDRTQLFGPKCLAMPRNALARRAAAAAAVVVCARERMKMGSARVRTCVGLHPCS